MVALGRVRSLLLISAASLLLAGCSLPWKKQQSGLLVQMSDGPNAQVFLNDNHLGQTPIQTQDLKPGTYQMRIVPDGNTSAPYETQIHLYPGVQTTVLWSFASSDPGGNGDILELEPLPSKDRAELSVITSPEGAGVSLNTTTYGLSPVILDTIQPGEYTLTVQAVGHLKKSLRVQVQGGFRLHIYSRLEKDTQGDGASPAPAASDSATLLPTPPPILSTPNPTPRTGLKTSPSPSPLATGVTAGSTNVVKPYVTIKETGTGWLRARDQAASSGQEVAKLATGGNFPYSSTLNGWFEVEYTPGKTAWVSGQYATLVK